MPPDIEVAVAGLRLEYAQLQTQLVQFQLQYEKRHGELSERLARLETMIPNLATHDDLTKMEGALTRMFDRLLDAETKNIATDMDIGTKQLVANTNDIDWLKRWFWLIVSFVLGLSTALVAHLFGKI